MSDRPARWEPGRDSVHRLLHALDVLAVAFNYFRRLSYRLPAHREGTPPEPGAGAAYLDGANQLRDELTAVRAAVCRMDQWDTPGRFAERISEEAVAAFSRWGAATRTPSRRWPASPTGSPASSPGGASKPPARGATTAPSSSSRRRATRPRVRRRGGRHAGRPHGPPRPPGHPRRSRRVDPARRGRPRRHTERPRPPRPHGSRAGGAEAGRAAVARPESRSTWSSSSASGSRRGAAGSASGPTTGTPSTACRATTPTSGPSASSSSSSSARPIRRPLHHEDRHHVRPVPRRPAVMMGRRLTDATFKARVSELRSGMTVTAAGRLADGMVAAADALRTLLTHDDPHVRHKAAVKVLELAANLRVQVELEDRMAELEARVVEPPSPAADSPPRLTAEAERARFATHARSGM